MSTLAWIIGTTLLGGVASIALAGAFALSARASWIPTLVSFAIGALLGAAFLEIIPHAFEQSTDLHLTAATLLGGILMFFALEKLVLWRHCHVDDCEAHADHAHDHSQHGNAGDYGRSGMLILIGDSFHNFVDGILVAAAFLESTQLGIVTAAAVIAHEIPQEIGDFVILLHSGYSKARAFALNLLSSLAMVAGGALGYASLQWLSGWINTVLALAAASMIYVAVADLIPGLHRRTELKSTVQQVVLIGLGVASIWIARWLTGE